MEIIAPEFVDEVEEGDAEDAFALAVRLTRLLRRGPARPAQSLPETDSERISSEARSLT